LHLVTLGQGLEAVALNCREVHEHVLAAVLRDESESLGIVEPLHRTQRHFVTPCYGACPPQTFSGGHAAATASRGHKRNDRGRGSPAAACPRATPGPAP